MTFKSLQDAVKDGLKLSPSGPLEDITKHEGRHKCETCGKRQAFYCAYCIKPFTSTVPRVDTPIRLIIARHKAQQESNSSVIPLRLLNPDQTQLYLYNQNSQKQLEIEQQVLSSHERDRCLVLYPSVNAIPLEDVTADQFNHYQSLVVLDCRWSVASGMATRPPYADMQHVSLGRFASKSLFWRCTMRDEGGFMCSLEAIYVFLRRRFDVLCPDIDYDGRYDDLLWYFMYQRNLIIRQYKEVPRLRDQPTRQLNRFGYALAQDHKPDEAHLEEKKRCDK
eukprot:Clim_evm33s240 gene=Clim_evmTU33s240